jgi:hypothetical protein
MVKHGAVEDVVSGAVDQTTKRSDAVWELECWVAALCVADGVARSMMLWRLSGCRKLETSSVTDQARFRGAVWRGPDREHVFLR